jgi:hypothetical protein
LCLGVREQSRDDHARVQLEPCTGASSQLWSIDSLRGNDFENLFQADRDRIAWQPDAASDYPVLVTVDGSRAICRTRTSDHSVGVLVGGSCVGRSHEREPIRAADFEVLYQAR